MITENTLLKMENCPLALVTHKDLPWTNCGYLAKNFVRETRVFVCHCHYCEQKAYGTLSSSTFFDTPKEILDFPFVECYRHEVNTDDLLIINVYIGICERCNRPHWAIEAPPYPRLRHSWTNM